jgi:hypothetical protein
MEESLTLVVHQVSTVLSVKLTTLPLRWEFMVSLKLLPKKVKRKTSRSTLYAHSLEPE